MNTAIQPRYRRYRVHESAWLRNFPHYANFGSGLPGAIPKTERTLMFNGGARGTCLAVVELVHDGQPVDDLNGEPTGDFWTPIAEATP